MNRSEKTFISLEEYAKMGSRKVMSRPERALQDLKEGNQRYLDKHLENRDVNVDKTKKLYNKPQAPKAVILACSDSRVPPELIFDQGLGDLFVIRNAGNVIDSHVLGSIEYATKYLKTPLVFVLGHNMCGAIRATIEGKSLTENVNKICEHIKYNIDLSKIDMNDSEEAARILEDANINHAINDIKSNPVIKELMAEGNLMVTGGKYCLDSGKVNFLDEK